MDIKNIKMKSSILKIVVVIICLLAGTKAKAQSTLTFGDAIKIDLREIDLNTITYDPAHPKASNAGGLSYSEVEGTPFWNEKWNPALLFFANGSKAKINQAKLNLYTGEIHYLSSDGTELAVENEGVNRLVFLNTKNLTQPIASFAKLINHTTGNGTAFYKILNTGKFQLILLQKQLVKTSPYDPIQGKTISSFYTKKDYAIYNEGKVIPLKDLDCATILAAIPLNSLTEDWLKYSKSKLKSEKEVTDYLEQVNLSYLPINGNIH
jgi:tellurite resistance-related uncharacterized protein